MATFMWCHVGHYASTLLSEASPRAIVLPSPYIGPFQFSDNFGDFVRCLTAAASTVLDSEEIAQALVDTLLQIASNTREASCIPTDLWSWLTKRPSLLPISQGRNYATARHNIKVVWALVDIEVLKSYLFVVWSEWDWLSNSCFDEMCIVIREDFGGIEMRHHRADLIQRLDDVLGQLDRGQKYFQKHKPWFDEFHIRMGKNQYRKLRETLMDMNSSMYALHRLCPSVY